MSKTINQALADLVTGLGESSSILSDNMTVSDYIADVETAIKDYAGGTAEAIIDDTEASDTKTYSSSKIESLIPEAPKKTSVVIYGSVVSDTFTVDSSCEYYSKKVKDIRDYAEVNYLPIFIMAKKENGLVSMFSLRSSGATGLEFINIVRGGGGAIGSGTTYHTMYMQYPPNVVLSSLSIPIVTKAIADPATT